MDEQQQEMVAQALLETVQERKDQDKQPQGTEEDPSQRETVARLVAQLEHSSDDLVAGSTMSSSLEPVFGLYNVSYVLPLAKNDTNNPVGGKWTRRRRSKQPEGQRSKESSGWLRRFGASARAFWIPQTRYLFQHVLPPNTTGIGALERETTTNDTTSSQPQPEPNVAVVAEAVNVVSLSVWGDWIRILVLLRGDCIPASQQTLTASSSAAPTNNNHNTTAFLGAVLTDPPNLQIRPWSPLAVQALFDAPRILVRPGRASTTTTRRRRRRSWLDWQVGPTSSVVLDTTFVNSQVRIGMGGTSGTRFVFGRLTEDQGAIGQPLHVWKEATEFQTILSSSQGPWSHRQALGGSLVLALAGGLVASLVGRWIRPSSMLVVTGLQGLIQTLGWSMTAVGTLLTLALAVSSGGIEQQQRRRQPQVRRRNPSSAATDSP